MTPEKLVIAFREFLKEEDSKIPVKAGDLLSDFEQKYILNKIWIIFDTETTGLLPHKRQITEIAGIAVDPSNLSPESIETYHKKINLTDETKKRIEQEKKFPEIVKSKSIEELLTMTDYYKQDAPRVEESVAMKEFNEFIKRVSSGKEVILAAHNATFDREFVSVRSSKYGISALNPRTFDSLTFSRKVFFPIIETTKNLEMITKMKPKGKVSYSLDTLAKLFDIKNKNWHAALADVKTLTEVMRNMLDFIRKNPDVDVRSSYEKSLKTARGLKAFSKGSSAKVKKQERDTERFLSKQPPQEPQSLQEAKLSKEWRRRARNRARRHERPYPNNEDRKWALKQQEKWNKESDILEQHYLKEIEYAQNLMRSTKEYLQKMKDIRREKLEEKEKAKFKKPKNIKTKKPKKLDKPPKTKEPGLKALRQKEKQKHVFAVGPGGSGYGPAGVSDGGPALEEEIDLTELLSLIDLE